MNKLLKIALTSVATIGLALFAYWLAVFNIETAPTHEQKLAGWISSGIIVAIGLVLVWRQSRHKPSGVK